MIICKRRVTRCSTVIDPRTQRAWVIRINEGARTVSVRLKGHQKWLTCTLKQIVNIAAFNEAAAIRAEKKRRKLERKQQREQKA